MKNKALTYKKKNQYLGIGTVLFFIVIYLLVISNTVNLYVTNKELRAKLQDAESAPGKRNGLKKKLDKFNNSLSTYIADSLKNREFILTLVSDFSQKNHITLKEVPPAITSFEKGFTIETNMIIAEGNYIDLLKLVYEIEQKNKVARPVSVNFQKAFDFKRKKDVLTLTLYLQNIRMNNHEENPI
jgi:hypothetical protein